MAGSHTLIVEPDDGRAMVLQLLAGAKKTIDLTIYEISDPQIMAALAAAQNRGVAVRVLYNWYSFTARMQLTDITPSITALTKAKVQCRKAPKNFEVTHEKAFAIDGTTGIVMSFNLNADYFGGTRDFGIVTTVPSEVAEITAVFTADWEGKPATPTVPSLAWSPVNSRSRISALIDGARATLDIYCEEAEDPGTLGALVTAAQRGVKVRFIAAVLSGEGKLNENARGVTTLLAGGVSAVCKSFLYIHAKMILADFGTVHAQAYVGSENLSCVSLGDNRECGIIVREVPILQRLASTFQADWAQPDVVVTPDPAPLVACAGEPAAREKVRKAQRSAGEAA
jgi:cardiolipin synthase A/B